MKNKVESRANLPSADLWRCFNCLIKMREYVHNNKLTTSVLHNRLKKSTSNDELIQQIINFAKTEQENKLEIANAPSKFAPFRSLNCRLQITVVSCCTFLVS
ncbi:unnamed protein product [Thelazia callipaeda]|uniref:Uncharacterized protein n=1 Tax=Thelazia callipaeda TaxID=103827 RepID=A0A0N5DAK7_THECL|nr:unnamed protein product [Thelazia callipaeda]